LARGIFQGALNIGGADMEHVYIPSHISITGLSIDNGGDLKRGYLLSKRIGVNIF
jgi:hypothetical protein